MMIALHVQGDILETPFSSVPLYTAVEHRGLDSANQGGRPIEHSKFHGEWFPHGAETGCLDISRRQETGCVLQKPGGRSRCRGNKTHKETRYQSPRPSFGVLGVHDDRDRIRIGYCWWITTIGLGRGVATSDLKPTSTLNT